MRLWSLNPKYLDRAGLLAVWREGLLAKKVLQNKTKGYKNHPQLIRFKESSKPLGAINSFLKNIYDEAETRGYKFSKIKIQGPLANFKIPVTNGQLKYEFEHLLKKLARRAPAKYQELVGLKNPSANLLFKKLKGGVEKWEKVSS